MQIGSLIKMLRKFPQDTEVRVAAMTSAYMDDNSMDLPIAGVTERMEVVPNMDIQRPQDSIVWIVSSHILPHVRKA